MSDDLSLADIPAGPELGELLDYVGQHRDELRGAELVEFITATRRQINHLEATCITAVNELAYCPPSILEQDELRTEPRSELAAGAIEAALGWSRGWARRFDDVSYLLVELFPATLDALCEGVIDLPTARAIADGLAVLDDPQVREDIEADMLARLAELRDKGRRVTSGAVARWVETAVVRADPAAAKKRHQERVQQRDVQLRPSVDSVADLAIHDLPAEEALRIYNRIDATAQALKRQGDERKIGQIRADIAASLLLGESSYVSPDDDTDDETEQPNPASTPMPSGGSIPVRAKNVLYISLTALLGLYEAGKTDPAILGGFGPVIDEVAERVLANHLDNPDASYEIVVTHPQTGKPLQLHRVDARLFTGRHRDAVTTRWPTCSWPTGCPRPAETCIIDHSHDYALGGQTVEANADPLCQGHNREKTKNGWRQKREGNDQIIWVSPFGDRHPIEAPAYGTPDPEPEPPPDPGPDDGSPPF